MFCYCYNHWGLIKIPLGQNDLVTLMLPAYACLKSCFIISNKSPTSTGLGWQYSSFQILNKFENDEAQYTQYTPNEEEELYLLLVYSNSTRTKQRKYIKKKKKKKHRIAVHHFIKTCPNNSIYWPTALCNLAPSSGYIIKKQLRRLKLR